VFEDHGIVVVPFRRGYQRADLVPLFRSTGADGASPVDRPTDKRARAGMLDAFPEFGPDWCGVHRGAITAVPWPGPRIDPEE
jgi:hypothetical protein